MAYTFLVFEFGGSEQIAQQARHKVDGWKQGFRLGKKLELKFDRKQPEAKVEAVSEAPAKSAKEGPKAKGKSKTASRPAGNAQSHADISSADIRLIVRLDFSDHEKLSSQRWMERIPGEEPFKSVKSSIVRAGDPEFMKTSDLFESLN